MPRSRRPCPWSPEALKSLEQAYPPILSIEQVSEMLTIPVSTLYAWHRQGRFKHCCMKLGKHLRFVRDCLLKTLFNGVSPDDN
jgi:hypothetical protein